MADTTTITVRVPIEIREKLDRLAEVTRRSRSFHAAEALSAYANAELEVVEGIIRGLDDMKAGRVTPHKRTMDEMRAHVRKVAAKSRRKSA